MEQSELHNLIRKILKDRVQDIPEIPQELLPLIKALCSQLAAERQMRIDADHQLTFFKASANAMPNPIFIKDEELRFVFFNHAYRKFFGLEEGENIGKRVQDLSYLSSEDRERYHDEDSEMLRTLSVIQYETVFDTASQGEVESLYWSKGFPVPETGSRGVIGEIVDISKEKEMQRELTRSMRALEVLMKDAKDASNTDPLTKLYNRNVMDSEIPIVISEAEMMNRPVCALLMDIDYFKQINDTYGHPCGDEILRKFSAMLKQNFRQHDIAVRYGGDEFMMILPGAGIRQAKAGAERLCMTVRENLKLPDGSNTTISVGITQWRAGEDLQAFLARADEALYLAKKAGRDRIAEK